MSLPQPLSSRQRSRSPRPQCMPSWAPGRPRSRTRPGRSARTRSRILRRRTFQSRLHTVERGALLPHTTSGSGTGRQLLPGCLEGSSCLVLTCTVMLQLCLPGKSVPRCTGRRFRQQFQTGNSDPVQPCSLRVALARRGKIFQPRKYPPPKLQSLLRNMTPVAHRMACDRFRLPDTRNPQGMAPQPAWLNLLDSSGQGLPCKALVPNSLHRSSCPSGKASAPPTLADNSFRKVQGSRTAQRNRRNKRFQRGKQPRKPTLIQRGSRTLVHTCMASYFVFLRRSSGRSGKECLLLTPLPQDSSFLGWLGTLPGEPALQRKRFQQHTPLQFQLRPPPGSAAQH
mmetsp:Transcript_73050/g.152555  ORF Transcript_73050/g.152555 Transcript_73050/m.152555 type:complete len:340 (+) Transcript_73050:1712-2731(+)